MIVLKAQFQRSIPFLISYLVFYTYHVFYPDFLSYSFLLDLALSISGGFALINLSVALRLCTQVAARFFKYRSVERVLSKKSPRYLMNTLLFISLLILFKISLIDYYAKPLRKLMTKNQIDRIYEEHRRFNSMTKRENIEKIYKSGEDLSRSYYF